MIPSRGLRWSSQTIGIGRWHLETFSARKFSSSTVQRGSIRASPLLSNNIPSIPRAHTRSQFSKTNFLIRNTAGLRFASTAPIVNATSETIPSVSSNPAAAAPLPDLTSSLDGATEFGTESLYNIPEGIGYLKSLGLEYGYGPTALMEWVLEHVHVYAGTPWWLSIALTAVLVRAVLFKVYVNAAENSTRMALLMPMTKPISDQMSAAGRAGNTELVMKLRGELKAITSKAGINPFLSLVPMVSVISGYGTFMILRAMSHLPVPGLESGGALWFYNLAIPDPLFLLPLASAGVLHWLLRKGGEMGISSMKASTHKILTWVLPTISFLFTFWLPAALQLTFFVTGLLSFGQASLFRQSWFRRFFSMTALPKTASAPTSPYQGKLRTVADPVLSQAQLKTRFQGAGNTAKKIEDIKKMSPPGAVGNPLTDLKSSWSDVVSSSRTRMKERSERMTAKEKERYEEKAQEEIRKAKWDLELARRLERQAAQKTRKAGKKN